MLPRWKLFTLWCYFNFFECQFRSWNIFQSPRKYSRRSGRKLRSICLPPHYGLASLIQELNVDLNGQTISKTSQYGYIHNWIKDWRQNFDVEIDNGLNTVDDPSKLYSYQNGRNMEGRVVPRLEFLASVYPNADGDKDINTLWKN